MLQSIRERAQGWVAWVIVSLLILVFAVWGIGSYFAPDPDPIIVDVDGDQVRLREFQRELGATRQQLRESLGGRFDEDLFSPAMLRGQVIERFVNQALIRRMTASVGMRVGDTQLARAIRAYPAFQVDGRFSADKYRQMLQYQGMTETGFEEQLRLSETAAQVTGGITGSAFATGAEVDRALALVDQTRDLAHVTLKPDQFAADLTLTDEQVQGYYQDHIAQFSEPERVQVDYVELNLDEMADRVEVPEKVLEDRYQAAKDSFKTAETRRARHILVNLAKDADDDAVTAAEKRIAAIRERLAGGEDFAAVAKEVSDDPGSAAKGGDLGFFGRGAMVASVDQAVFGLPLGELSGPVRSPYGFHLIEVTEIRPETVKPFAEVRGQLLREEQLREAEENFYDLGETLANVAYEQPGSLEPAAEAVGLEIRHAGPFDRNGGTGVTGRREFIDVAFRDDLIETGSNSEPIELGPTQVLVLRVADHQPATPKPLAEVRAEVERALREQEAASEARRLGEALLEQLQAGGDPEKTLADHGRSWTNDGPVAMGPNPGLPTEALAAAFALPPPNNGPGSFGGAQSGSDYLLLWVKSVVDGDPAKVEHGRRQAVEAGLGRRWGEAELAALLAELRSRADVKVYPNNIP